MKKSSLTVPEQQDLWDRRVSLIAEAVAARPDLPTPPDEARRKMLAVIEGIAGGDRWGVALEKAGWTWKDFSVYTWKNQSMIEMLRLIESTARMPICANWRTRPSAGAGGVEEMFSPHGKKVGAARLFRHAAGQAAAPRRRKICRFAEWRGGGLTST